MNPYGTLITAASYNTTNAAGHNLPTDTVRYRSTFLSLVLRTCRLYEVHATSQHSVLVRHRRLSLKLFALHFANHVTHILFRD